MNNQIPDNPNINVLKASESGIFTNYIYKAIPLAFDESMSYYETLCGLLNYLQTVIIPTVNNNADAVAELQNLYIELKTYVDDYFTNLDVQEEINNKLDAMAEDGSLTLLIKDYVDPIYEEFENQINNELTQMNNEIDLIDNKVTNIASGAPIPVSSTSGMTDTTKIYLNTTDGYWYWYNGESWQQGGVYQASQIANGSITNDMLVGKITTNKLIYGNSMLDLAINVYDNKRIGGYNTQTFTPNLTNDTDFITYEFNASDLLAVTNYFEIGSITSEVDRYAILQYTADEKARLFKKSDLETSTYYYNEDKNCYYFKLTDSYDKFMVAFSKNNTTFIALSIKPDFIKSLENNLIVNKNNNTYNINITNILDYASEIYNNSKLSGYSTSTYTPNIVSEPYNTVYIFNTQDIPSGLRNKILYYLNKKTTGGNVIISYEPNVSAYNITRSTIISSENYDAETNYYQINSGLFSIRSKLAISIDPTNNGYNLYSDIWGNGNPNYNIEHAENSSIVLPSKLYGLQNHDYLFYYDNCIKYGIGSKFQKVNIGSNDLNNFDNCANITSSGTNTLNVYKNDTKNVSFSKNFNFLVSLENTGTSTKKVLLIGDSLTHANVYPHKLYDLFQDDTMNIELLGTQGTAPYLNEGHNGWRAYTYTNCAQGSDDVSGLHDTNPFYNPSTNSFDFNYYMQNNNYSSVDFVFICLGTNDISRSNHNSKSDIISYYNIMINSIKEFNSDIKIVLWLPPTKGTYNNTYGYVRNDNYIFKMHEYLIDTYDNDAVENVYIVNSNLMINPKTDYPTETVNICGENITTVSDITHLNSNGYNKIAYPLYYIIKYLSQNI